MRVYLFDVESGIYAGEDYGEPNEVREEDGITGQPPPLPTAGLVAVCQRGVGDWKLVQSDALKGVTYD